MPINNPGVDTWEVNIVGPADGDAVASAIANLGHEDSANRTVYLRTRLIPAIGGYLPINVAPSYAPSPGWAFDPIQYRWEQDNIALPYALMFPFHLWPPCSFAAVRVRVQGGAGHVALPAQLPMLWVYRQQAGVVTLLASVTDPSASVAAYEAPHTLTAALAVNEAIAIDKQFYAVLTGESGANSIPGLALLYAAVDLVPA